MRKPEVDNIMSTMLESAANVSDLNLTVGKPPQVESSGQLIPVNFDDVTLKTLTPFQTEVFALNLINSDRRLTENLIRQGSCDLSYSLPGKARFRVNIFSQRSTYSVVCRKLESRIPTLADLKLPKVLGHIAEEKNGLVLLTGATGSGKSSTLAAVLNIINEQKAVHVLTLEDPVEFVHPHKKSTFNQREMGTDFDAFASGLRAALRQAPKVILVGEMRDRETVEIGLTAAETGHLVLSTLHTIDAGQTINRIIGMFEQEEEVLIRNRLSDTVRWIVSQRLLPKVGGGRVAAIEIMRTNLRVKDSIIHGESEGKTFYEIVDAGETYGMQTFDKSIINLYKVGLINEETAIAYASRKAIVGRGVDNVKSAKGEKTTDIDSLSLDKDYSKKVKVPVRK
ncbi:twitching motility protein PilT [Candidatus Magnetobacterium bavaricum]|uniref:Twitching motility protein PilT n=1 Tax=Candidatus Magnetobacterium bavaricum TaxID=29290 RepID=A0A0F3GK86_9BACT|nr:twitching motility protein PilT [Candidatus Magnetobacterium bavaricum]